MTKKLVFVAFVSLLFTFGCSKDDDSGSDNGGIKPQIDTSTFKNTVDAAGFKTKTNDAKAYFTAMDGMRTKFVGRSSKAFFITRSETTEEELGFCTPQGEPTITETSAVYQEECTKELEDGTTRVCQATRTIYFNNDADPVKWDKGTCTTTSGTSTATITDTAIITDTSTTTTISTSIVDESFESESSFTPEIGDITNCDEAFTAFESLYTGIKEQFTTMTTELSNPDNAAITGAGLKETTPSDKAAVAYEFKPADNVEGMKISGKIEGGASDTMLYLSQVMDMEIDFGKFIASMGANAPTETANAGTITEHESSSFAADLDKKMAELIMDMTMNMVADGKTTGMAMKGQFTVSDGEEKYIKEIADMASTGDQAVTSHYEMSATLTDENTIDFSGTVNSNGKEGTISFKIVKGTDNKCSVSDMVNTVPES